MLDKLGMNGQAKRKMDRQTFAFLELLSELKIALIETFMGS